MRPNFRLLFSNRRMRWVVRFLLVTLGVSLAIGLFYLPSSSQAVQSARIVEIVEQPNTLRVLINQARAQIGNEASLGQRIVTEAAARAGLRLTSAAGLRLGKNSALTIGSACIRLEQGKVLVSGTGGCIGSVIATSRGTLFVMERMGARGEIKVLQGSIAVSSLVDPNDQPITVSQGQKIIVRATGAVGALGTISRSEFEEILAGELFQGFQIPLPNEDRLLTVLQQLPLDTGTARLPNTSPPNNSPPTNPASTGLASPPAPGRLAAGRNDTGRIARYQSVDRNPTSSASRFNDRGSPRPFWRRRSTPRQAAPVTSNSTPRQPTPTPSNRPTSRRWPQSNPFVNEAPIAPTRQPADLEPYLQNPSFPQSPPTVAPPVPPSPSAPPPQPEPRSPGLVDTNELQQRVQQDVDATRTEIEREVWQDRPSHRGSN